jgi:hypothetical protein
MDIGAGLAGLSATYPGYMAQEDQTAKTQLNQEKQRAAAIRMLGANVAGAALANNGPQAPPPGQASVPARPPMPPQGAAAPQGVVAPQAPTGAPAAPLTGKMSLQDAVQRILRATPGVANHPELLLSALTHFNDIGVLDPEAEAKIAETNQLHTQARAAAAKGLKASQSAAEPAPPAAAAAPAQPPPVAMLRPGGINVMPDGSKWRLINGQPQQVQ